MPHMAWYRPLLQALMHLASDAVRAAAESPFLDGALDASAGVLCCLTLPPAGLQVWCLVRRAMPSAQCCFLAALRCV